MVPVELSGIAVGPIKYDTLEYSMATFGFLSTMSTSLLFLLRVRAVYQNSRAITALFGSLWLSGLGVYIWSIIAVHAGKAFENKTDTSLL